MDRRCVITGIGAVTPVGNDAEEMWNSVKNGVNGIGYITKFDTSEFKVKIAGEVRNFDPLKYVEKKELKRNDAFAIYAIAAAQQAFDTSGLEDDKIDHERFGCMVGSGIGGFLTMETQIARVLEKGSGRISPLFVPMSIINMAAGNISIRFGAKGVCESVVTACASGTNNIGEAFRYIKHGYADICFAGGSEAAVTKTGVAGFTNMTALTACDDPETACKPFDKNRSGFVLSDGAGIVMLEELEHAKKRGARIYAEVVGYGTTGDAYHMTAPCEDGDGAARAMKLAMAEAGITPEDVDYINAHGTSTHANDSAETKAIKKALGEYAYKVPVSSTKSMTGHLLGAAGAVEAIICAKALEEGFIPPTINYSERDEECDLDYVPNVGRKADIKYALSNSLGFGGHNAVLCLKRWDGE
ncbi:MAG: beta-ketoacyl-ACP synthase II [Clostridia bacterium]|nr:beta-ketoacyl-ACP synthase II [Clostridia bacterium]